MMNEFEELEGVDIEFIKLPIDPVEDYAPLVPVEKWKEKSDPKRLVKTFEFFDEQQRNEFVRLLLDLEEVTQHYVQITLANTGRHVRVTVSTPEAGVITEIDCEFSKSVDDLYIESYELYDSVYGKENEEHSNY
jgi:pterin-4a-carbinolamine dehydratase